MTQLLPLAPGAVDPASIPIESVDQLVDRLKAGAKTAPLKVGTEHEKLGYELSSMRPIIFDGPAGLEVILREMARRYGWTEVFEADRTIALTRRGASISLEPGGQLELSGAPYAALKDGADEVDNHFTELRSVAEPLGVGFFGMGYCPLHPLSAVPLMPKARYRRMAEHMRSSGSTGLNMMLRTCTVQANLDFTSEADMGHKLRTALWLSSLVTSLFAISPYAEKRDTGWQSHRMRMWFDTDNTRCGLLRFAMESPASFQDYVTWAMQVPLIFVRRDGQYQPPPGGLTLGRWMKGEGGLGKPTLADFDDLISTLFPDVRLKTYLEVRTADCGPRDMLLGLPALWKGILYDVKAAKRALRPLEGFSFGDHQKLRALCAEKGLKAKTGTLSVKEACVEMVLAAQEGLRAQGAASETAYLDPLLKRARSGKSLADELLEASAKQPGEPVMDNFRLC